MQTVSGFEYSQSDILGHGAFALVFKGRRKKNHQPVAIKQIALKSMPGKLSNIRQKEIAILKDLKHPNIVQLYDYLETKTDIFLVMEYCNGGDLGDYLIAKKTLSEASIRHLGRHIAGALQVLFKFQIIHRDIKPQNLLLSYQTNGGNKRERSIKDSTVKLADFGFARYLVGADMAATLCGSPLYMAPEILLGRRYDNKADLWSVGTILFQCLTGTAPFLASNPHALRKKYERENLVPKIPEGTSPHMSDLLLQLLKKSPKERITHDDFFEHAFLKNHSSLLPSEPAFMSHLPSQHVKSSPVPIQRHNSSSPSPRYSPHRTSSVDMQSFSPSPASSGPPISHRVGSQGSLPYYTLPSPNNSDIVTDQGFILVDLPGSTGSARRYSSASSSSPGQHSSIAASPAASSSSHSRSSSLNRYTSLTTPFYQAPLRAQHNIPLTIDNSGSNGSTPVGTPSIRGALSRSNSARMRSDASLGKSPPLPFGRLIQCPPTQYSNSPMSSSPHSISPFYQNMLSRQKSNSLSPLPTPPSIPSPVGPSARQLGQGQGGGGGMRYAHASQGSATKLSSLVEEEQKTSRGTKTASPSKESQRQNSACDDYITFSSILNSDEEEEEEENFPMSLTMSLNSSQEDQGDSVSPVHTQTGLTRQTSLEHRVKRTSSFTHHHPRLSQELAEINKRATTLSAHGDPLDPSTPTEQLVYDLQVSPSSDIVAFKPPFSFSDYNSSQKEDVRSSQEKLSSKPRRRKQSDESQDEGTRMCLVPLNQSLVLAKELTAMAKARQGPIMLMSTSTSLTDSGITTRVQRWSEQMVLYAKSISVLESGLRQYEIQLAASNIEPSQTLKNAEAEVKELLQTCLEAAKLIREQERIFVKDERHIQSPRISAEKLLCLEALDMCKVAVLNELSGEAKECIKKYRRAKLILHYLLMDAQTPKDKATLHKYLQSVQSRIHHLSATAAALAK